LGIETNFQLTIIFIVVLRLPGRHRHGCQNHLITKGDLGYWFTPVRLLNFSYLSTAFVLIGFLFGQFKFWAFEKKMLKRFDLDFFQIIKKPLSRGVLFYEVVVNPG
jgi:hypothetical protein